MTGAGSGGPDPEPLAAGRCRTRIMAPSPRIVSGFPAACLMMVGLSVAPLALAGPAPPPGFVERPAAHGYHHTMAALKRALPAHGMRIVGRLDQGRRLSLAGVRLAGGERIGAARSLLVAAPRLDRRLLLMNPAAGAVLPLRIYVWQVGRHSYVGYYQPSDLLRAISRHLARPGRRLDRRLAAVLRAVTR